MRVLELKNLAATAHHHQTNWQVETCRETVFTRLGHYVAHQKDDWDIFVRPLTYAQIIRVHGCTALSPSYHCHDTHLNQKHFEFSSAVLLDLSRNASPRPPRSRLLMILALMSENVEKRLTKSGEQKRYNYNYKNPVRERPVFHTDELEFVDTPPRCIRLALRREPVPHSRYLMLRTNGCRFLIIRVQQHLISRFRG